ncbi:MAG: amidohydrolase family protein [Gemmatimonadota bacterium]|uniref:amidohydrolase family protein n=1 Tax=Candidatus Palauibacter scopulicola TaxID=3056741 RepID=UPI0023969A74|nr:amidohydrolase family protein [Candidatus Palauibacter scopulicola]MDE2663371.1 amidohydrolase family protein [Candidatus Palauibacter scopulicola]
MYQLSVPRLRRPSSALIPLAARFLLPLALFLLSGSLLLPTASHAQDREVQVTVSEGTNMAAAVSPDGSRIVLDLQGTLWVMDAGGGEARAITDMYYDARQPQWAPDGSRIVFQSFRDGRWHIWSIASDGTDPVQHTFGPYDEREPAYSPDGGAIVFASDRSGNYDIWTLDVSGGPGDGRIQRVTDAPTHEFTPQWSPDGESLAYASDRALGAIVVRESGGSIRVVARNAGAISPAWSPDGSRIAYSAVVQGQTGLWVADAGADDSGGGGAATPTRLTEEGADVFPFRPMWMGDGMGDGTDAAEIAYTGDGRIRRVSADGAPGADIPFEATFAFTRRDYERAPRSFEAGGPEPVQGIVAPAVSPDGRHIAFTALGDLWLLDIGAGGADGTDEAGGARPRRLTDDPFVDLMPAWSRDGSRLAYASDRAGSLDIWVRDMATGTETRATAEPGGEVGPVFSPAGDRIVFTSVMGLQAAVQAVDLATGELTTIRGDLFAPSRPSFSPDGRTIAMSVLSQYSSRFREGRNEILLQPLDGGETRVVTAADHENMGVRALDGPVWSPDGRRMAYASEGVLWMVEVDADGVPSAPPTRLSNHHADAISWTGDSRSIVYQSTRGLRRYHLDDGRSEEIPLRLEWQRPAREGAVLVRAARVWDGVSDEISRDMDVIIEGNRIVSVVPHSDANLAAVIDAGGEVVDAGDLTVLPGLVDMHSHMGYGMGEALGRAFLAYGVTTIRDPTSDPYEIAERRESIDSGRRIGPREFATGRTMDGNRIYYSGAGSLGPNGNLELELDRAEHTGYSLIKTYVRMPDLIQRRIIEFAHGIGIPVASHEIYPAVAHGQDHVEHISGTSRRGYSPKVTAMYRTYDDVIQLLTASGMTITPTMALMGGWWKSVGDDPSWTTDARFEAVFPEGMAEAMTARALTRGRAGGIDGLLADAGRTVTRVVRGGGKVVAGTDSPIIPYGAALIAEVENYVWGGLTEVEALRTATSVAAEALAMEGEIGTLSAGALADILIVEGNPLEDIEDLRRARIVIKDGEIFRLEDLLQPPRALVP